MNIQKKKRKRSRKKKIPFNTPSNNKAKRLKHKNISSHLMPKTQKGKGAISNRSSFGDKSDGSMWFYYLICGLLIIWSPCHFKKPSWRAFRIHGCRQHSVASGMLSQLLWRVLCSGQDWSSSLTSNTNMAALHTPWGQNSSCMLLLLLKE